MTYVLAVRARIGISCARYLYSVIEPTPIPWDSGSRIDTSIYLLSTRVDLSFAVHKLAKFSANPDKVHFEGLVHLLRNIRYNKTLGTHSLH